MPRLFRLVLILLALAAVFAGLRTVHWLQPEPTTAGFSTEKVVVVGVTGRFQPDAGDRLIIDDNRDRVQIGAMSTRARYVSDCAAAGWTTIGAGRRAAVGEPGDGELCSPKIVDGLVVDWDARLSAARAHNGDARLGTLAAASDGCVAAVGPGAALAAARPDGAVADYRTPQAFADDHHRLSCPITLVDAGAASDAAVAALAAQDNVTVFVAGIGPAAGSTDPGVQLIYRLDTTMPGWMTSASTRREGVVTLTDLTRTLIDFGQPGASSDLVNIDGASLTVLPADVTAADLAEHLAGLAALSDSTPIAYLVLGIGGALIVVAMIICLLRGRYAWARVVGPMATVMTAAMMLTGAVPWQHASRPTLVLCVLMWALVVVLSGFALLGSRLVRVPVAIVAAAITVAIVTADAALGGMIQPGSLLNSRPIFGLRWYGFGNVTFGAYAAAGLVLADFVATRIVATRIEATRNKATRNKTTRNEANRIEAAGHRRWATAAVLLIGFAMIVCQGWPTMGTDFGGVIALTPGVLWLALMVSGVRVTWAKVLAIGVAAVVAIGTISMVDWLRGPGLRSHLGNFVQRVIDGEAIDVIARKAVASWETISNIGGISAVVAGALIWVVIFRYLAPRIELTDLRTVATAALVTAFLGTVLNDGGISVWITLTGAFCMTCLAYWLDRVAELKTTRLPVVADG